MMEADVLLDCTAQRKKLPYQIQEASPPRVNLFMSHRNVSPLQLAKAAILAYHESEYHLSFLSALSSRAILLFGPHLDLMTSVTNFCCFCFSSDRPSVTNETKIREQSNFFASAVTPHVTGSSFRSRLISSIWASVTL